MSGHSHAKTVKRVKDANDAKRGKIFSKLSRLISVAAKQGTDPETNTKLRQALDEAKRFNMPKDNVEKAIKRAVGELGEGEKLEEVLYEGLGPDGVTLILEGITDNKNRTLVEVRQILQKHNCKLADEGSVKWLFKQKGIITVSLANQEETTKDTLELKAIDAGAEDVRWHKVENEDTIEIITNIEDLEKTKQNLERAGVKIETATLGWLAKDEIEAKDKDKAACEKLFEDLDESDAIQEIYSNLKV